VTTYVVLLRAVNVGGTGKLPMEDLKRIAESAGLSRPRTYIASGNLVAGSDLSEIELKRVLEAKLAEYAGRPLPVLVRSAAEMAEILGANPFPKAASNRTVAFFLDTAPPANTLDTVTGRNDEVIALGKREIYVHYGSGMGNSKLTIPAAKAGTARNMNTVAKLASMTAEHLSSGAT
jgi:uncharacterized protein (DUF1697 family)